MLDCDTVGDRVAGLADDADGAHVGTALFQRQDDARREPAAADRDQHRVCIRRLLGEFEADGALAGDHALVLEGVDERRARPLGVSLCRGDRVFEASPVSSVAPPYDRVASILAIGASCGMKIVAGIPASRAAHATAWPWLPALAATTPARRSASPRVAMVL